MHEKGCNQIPKQPSGIVTGRQRIFCCWLLCLCMGLCGCSSGALISEYGGSGTDYGTALLTDEVNLSYEVPVGIPNVFVDRLGYEPESDKTVIFRSGQLPSVFTIREKETGQIVYTGEVKTKGKVSGQGEYNSYGDFSDFRQPGQYYIQIDTYGESYPFRIHDNLYYALFKSTWEQLDGLRSRQGESQEGWQMEEKGDNKEINASLCLYQLLLSYEMFPEIHTDTMEIAESGNGIPDLLDECRYEVEWLIKQAQVSPDGGGSACGYRAVVLAKYAYLTKSIDSAFAVECVKEAELAWKRAARDDTVAEDLMSLAAAELYRATGNRQYGAGAEEALSKSVEKGEMLTTLEFLSGVTYLNTKNKVTVELCDELIRKLMEEAETIAEKSKENSFLIADDTAPVQKRELLDRMLRVCVVNHIITNHEYNTVIENYFHYLLGRNPESRCYVSYWDGQGAAREEPEDPVENAAFLFVLSGLLGNQ